MLNVTRLATLGLFALCVACTPMDYRQPPSADIETQDGPPSRPVSAADLVDASPADEPLSRYGNPDNYTAIGTKYFTMDSAENYSERGVASWYGKKFAGRKTSSGEPYDPYLMTAAHARLPLPTYVEVTHLSNGKKAIVKVNDRGPFSRHRLIDLSYAAAVKLGIDKTGTARVKLRVVTPEPPEQIAEAPPSDTKTSLPDNTARATQEEDVAPPTAHADPVFLQLGAFSVKENASRLVDVVQSKAFANTYLIATTINGQTLYKVRVGPYNDPSAAQFAANKLATDGIESKIVSE